MRITEELWPNGPGPVSVFVDGCARGNPGHAGCGVLVKDANGKILLRKSRYLGSMTNNVAEYSALIEGLREAAGLGAEEITVVTDSELVVKQMSGLYRVKDEKLKLLFAEAQRQSRGFSSVKFEHVERRANREADLLANEAVEGYLKGRQKSEKAERPESEPSAGSPLPRRRGVPGAERPEGPGF
ncbi:MAG: ribonuclease HI family protein [Candidatus Eisenbacteria bacterium]